MVGPGVAEHWVGDWVLLSVVLPYSKILKPRRQEFGRNSQLADPYSWLCSIFCSPKAKVPHHPAMLGRAFPCLPLSLRLVHQPQSCLPRKLVRMCLNPSFHETLCCWPTCFRGLQCRPEEEIDVMRPRRSKYPAEISGPRGLRWLTILILHRTSVFQYDLCVPWNRSEGWKSTACW